MIAIFSVCGISFHYIPLFELQPFPFTFWQTGQHACSLLLFWDMRSIADTIIRSHESGTPKSENIWEDCSRLGITLIDATRSAEDRIRGTLYATWTASAAFKLRRQGIKSSKSSCFILNIHHAFFSSCIRWWFYLVNSSRNPFSYLNNVQIVVVSKRLNNLFRGLFGQFDCRFFYATTQIQQNYYIFYWRCRLSVPTVTIVINSVNCSFNIIVFNS